MKNFRFLKWITVLVILSLAMSECGVSAPPAASVPQVSSYTDARIWLTGWNLHTSDPQVAEVLMGNQNPSTVALRNQWWDAASRGELTYCVGCPDGRHGRAFALGAKQFSEGILDPKDFYYLDTGSLAGTVPDTQWVKNAVRYWTLDGPVASRIDVITHFCEGGACGAQDVLAKILADPAVLAELEQKGLGLTGNWAKGNIYSPNPGNQGIFQGLRIWEMTERRIEVTVWVFDHELQTYKAVAQFVPGKGIVSVIPADQLASVNWDGVTYLDRGLLTERAQAMWADSEINGPVASQIMKDMGMNPGKIQTFRRIYVTDNPIPDPLVLGSQIFGPDEAFNSTVFVAPNASLDEFKSALDATFAAGDYGLGHANAETEVFGVFLSRERAEAFYERYQLELVAKKHMADASMQEVTLFITDSRGNITESMLVKPAHVAVDQVVREFQGMVPLRAADNGWLVMRDVYRDGSKTLEIKFVDGHPYWRKGYPQTILQTDIDTMVSFYKAQAVREGFNPDGFYADWNGGKPYVYLDHMPATEAVEYFKRTGDWTGFSKFMQETEDVLAYYFESEQHFALTDDIKMSTVLRSESGRPVFSDVDFMVRASSGSVPYGGNVAEYRGRLREHFDFRWSQTRELLIQSDPTLDITLPRKIEWNSAVKANTIEALLAERRQLKVPEVVDESSVTRMLQQAEIPLPKTPGALSQLVERLRPFARTTVKVLKIGGIGASFVLDAYQVYLIFDDLGNLLFRWGPGLQAPSQIYFPVSATQDPVLYNRLFWDFSGADGLPERRMPWQISSSATISLDRVWNEAQYQIKVNGPMCSYVTIDNPTLPMIPSFSEIVGGEMLSPLGFCVEAKSVNEPERITIFNTNDVESTSVVFEYTTAWILIAGDPARLGWVNDSVNMGEDILNRMNVAAQSSGADVVLNITPSAEWK